jgi:hypothetical protein
MFLHNEVMSERIVCLSLLRLKPGMRLARPLMRPDGAILMPAGAELDEESLQHLPQRGVEFGYVYQTEDRSPETIAQELAEAEERVRFIFRGSTSDIPGMGETRDWLRDVMITYRRKGVA